MGKLGRIRKYSHRRYKTSKTNKQDEQNCHITKSLSSVTGSPICPTNFNTIYEIWTIPLNPQLKLLLTSLIYWKRKVLLATSRT